jgi:MoxR-like ATPase
VYLGASPRGSIALYRSGQALAGLLGRDYVIPDDIKSLGTVILSHRVILSTDAAMTGRTGEAVLVDVLEEIPVPVSR